MKILIEESVLRQALNYLETAAFRDSDRDEAITALRTALDAAEGVEPIYAFRRKGQDAFCTCDKSRYRELTGKSHLFETTIFYTHPVPAVPEVPDGATHYQPHQKTYYKRVSATEWYLWSCTGKGWIESKGTGDSAEWVMLNPVAAPTPPTNTAALAKVGAGDTAVQCELLPANAGIHRAAEGRPVE